MWVWQFLISALEKYSKNRMWEYAKIYWYNFQRCIVANCMMLLYIKAPSDTINPVCIPRSAGTVASNPSISLFQLTPLQIKQERSLGINQECTPGILGPLIQTSTNAKEAVVNNKPVTTCTWWHTEWGSRAASVRGPVAVKQLYGGLQPGSLISKGTNACRQAFRVSRKERCTTVKKALTKLTLATRIGCK